MNGVEVPFRRADGGEFWGSLTSRLLIFEGERAMVAAIVDLTESKRISGKRTIDGVAIPTFHYVWSQESFNPVTNEIYCSISFDLKGRPRMKRAFTYDWRMWSLPELRELILEAGFREAQVWTDGWDDKNDEPDNKYRLRTNFENDEAWLAYVVGLV